MLESHLKSFELNSIFAAQITLFPPQSGVSKFGHTKGLATYTPFLIGKYLQFRAYTIDTAVIAFKLRPIVKL